MTICRIDGDLVVYRAGFGGDVNAGGPQLSHSLHNVNGVIKSCVNEVQTFFGDISEVVVYLSGSSADNYRHSIAKSKGYKANRAKVKRPKYFNEMREYMQKRYYVEMSKGEEADDLMGIHQSTDPFNSVIVSWDKDMRMIPGFHYNYLTKKFLYSTDNGYYRRLEGKPYGYGLKWFYAQMLLGDTADNIPGIPGYGPAKVEKELKGLNNHKEIFEKICQIYYNKGYGEEYLLEQGQLLWIRREENEMWEFPYEYKVEAIDNNSGRSPKENVCSATGESETVSES